MTRYRQLLQLLVWVFAYQLIGLGLGCLVRVDVDRWYISLEKSSLTPPGEIFGLVWAVLYIILALVGWRLWQRHAVFNNSLRRYYAMQMALNWSWTPIFFTFHWIHLAFVLLVLLVMINFVLLCQLSRVSRWLFALYVPYWIWLGFATYLCGYIAVHG